MDAALQVVRRLIDEVWHAGKLDALADMFADEFDHGGYRDTVDGLLDWHRNDEQTWADARYEILSEVSDGETVAVRWRRTARHVGPWGPVLATGRTVIWDGVHFFTVRDGKIVRLWAIADIFSKAIQLGGRILPPHPA